MFEQIPLLSGQFLTRPGALHDTCEIMKTTDKTRKPQLASYWVFITKSLGAAVSLVPVQI